MKYSDIHGAKTAIEAMIDNMLDKIEDSNPLFLDLVECKISFLPPTEQITFLRFMIADSQITEEQARKLLGLS